MRHFRSILYALVLAPAVWVLAGVGLTHDLASRGRDDFAVESITGLSLLVLAGAAYAILVFAPISPAGPTLAGLAYLGVAIWALRAPSGYAGVWPSGVVKDGFDLSRPGYGLAALLAIPMIVTCLSARRWARYEPLVLPIVGQVGRARGAAPVAGEPIAAARTAWLPGRRNDPDPTTVLRLPEPNGTATLVASSGADTTVIHTGTALSNDPAVAASPNLPDDVTATGDISGGEPTEVVADVAETAAIGEAAQPPEEDEPTVVVPKPAAATDAAETTEPSAARVEAPPLAVESDGPSLRASTDEALAAPPNSADAPVVAADAAESATSDEPSAIVPNPAETPTTFAATLGDAAQSSASDDAAADSSALDPPTLETVDAQDAEEADDDEPTVVTAAATESPDDAETTRTSDLPKVETDSKTTGTHEDPDSEVTRPIPFPRPVPAAERFDDTEEPTRALRAVDSDRTRDLRDNTTDDERTEVIRLPIGDPAERTQVVRLPQNTGPTLYRPGEQTRIIPFPGTGDVGGDETQIIRLPVRSNDGENTQVIRPSLVEPPPERTEVIRLPLKRADHADIADIADIADETEEQKAVREPSRPPSIAEAEAPDTADDPTSRLEPQRTRTEEDSQPSMTVMNMERPPED